ncbi:MAG: sigma-70 family RNA polymerase sigma factor [Bacteroidales bacterium]|nr:sigma-70 family RNA polymerase sigma factor [Bacteroidales bacterium]
MSKKKEKEDAFMAMLKSNEVGIYKICRKFAKQDDEYVADLYNEVVLRLWEEYSRFGLFRFRKESKESTWIYKIAYNTVVTYNKRNVMKYRYVKVDVQLADVAVEVEELSCFERFDALIKGLDEIDRKIVSLFLENKSYAQIGEEVGMTESAVGTRMSRIVQKLKKQVQNNNGK